MAAGLDQLRRASLDPPAQAALLQALSSVAPRDGAVTAKADGPLAEPITDIRAAAASLGGGLQPATVPASANPASSARLRVIGRG
jgi:hypothetical protein